MMFGKPDRSELDILVLNQRFSDLQQEVKEIDSFIGDREKLERYSFFYGGIKATTLSALNESVKKLELRMRSLCALVEKIVQSTGDGNIIADGGAIFSVHEDGVVKYDGGISVDGHLSSITFKRKDLAGLVGMYPEIEKAMGKQKKEEE